MNLPAAELRKVRDVFLEEVWALIVARLLVWSSHARSPLHVQLGTQHGEV